MQVCAKNISENGSDTERRVHGVLDKKTIACFPLRKTFETKFWQYKLAANTNKLGKVKSRASDLTTQYKKKIYHTPKKPISTAKTQRIGLLLSLLLAS